MTSLLIILKYTGSFFAAFYGIYATLTDFRVEKNGKKILSRKGYFGIALLALSSFLALSTDGLKDYKENLERKESAQQERKIRDDAQFRDEAITARLTEQLTRLEGLSSSLGEASNKLDANSKVTDGISTNLGVQLKATTVISRQLGSAVRSLNSTYQTASSMLEETVDRIDSVDVYLSIAVDPLAITNSSGQSILSPESLRLLEEDKKGTIDLSSDDDGKGVLEKDFLAHYDLIRKAVFLNWSAAISLDATGYIEKTTSGPFEFDFSGLLPNMIRLEQGDSNVTSFLVLDLSSEPVTINERHKGYKALMCLVKYTLSPNRYVGVRKFNDLNGAQWTVALLCDSDLIKLSEASLSVAATSFGSSPLQMSKEEIQMTKKGLFEGQKTIPDDHFKTRLQRFPATRALAK